MRAACTTWIPLASWKSGALAACVCGLVRNPAGSASMTTASSLRPNRTAGDSTLIALLPAQTALRSDGPGRAGAQAGRLFEWLSGDGGRLPPGEQPAAGGGDDR